MAKSKLERKSKPTLYSLFGKECVFREGTNILSVIKVSEASLTELPNPDGVFYDANGEYNVKFIGVANIEVSLGEDTYESMYDVAGYANIEEEKISIIDVRKR